MSGLRAALTLSTRLRVPGRSDRSGDGPVLGWLPAVGILVAALGTLVRAVTLPLVGELPSAVLAVAAAVAVTGALHEDGLADTADAAWGGWSVARRLEILRDSRLGTYGTSALTVGLLLRVTLIAPLSVGATGRALLAAEVAARATSLPLVRLLPSARDDGQLAHLPDPSPISWAIAGVTVIPAAVIGFGSWAPAALLTAALSAGAVGYLARVRFAGLTGDLLGAANQVALVAVLLVFAAVDPGGAS